MEKPWGRTYGGVQGSYTSRSGIYAPILNSFWEFLQAGMDQKLSVSTLKVQVTALCDFLENKLIEGPLIKFKKAISRSPK